MRGRSGWIALALTLLWPPLAPAGAQSAAPRIEAWLHQTQVVLQTESSSRPRLRLYDAGGRLLSDSRAQGEKRGAGWRLDLPALGRRGYLVRLRPGHRIEIELGAIRSRLVVPDLPAALDAENDRISGRAPAGARSIGLRLHRDPAWFGAPNDLPGRSLPVGGDGRFTADLSGELDLAPGWWAEVYAQLPEGHVVIQGLAVPAVTFSAAEPYAYVRADAASEVVVTLRNTIETELLRTGPGLPLGSGLFRVPLYPGGNPDFGAFTPREGQAVGVEVDGLLRIDAPLPRALASLDREGSSLWGLTEPGARIRWRMAGESGTLAELQAQPDGSFETPLPAQPLDAESAADLLLWPGGAVARLARASLPRQQVLLYDNRIAGSLPGWGLVRGEHWRGSELLAWDLQEIHPGEGFQSAFRRADGSATSIQPGDRLVYTPELGRRLALEVPELEVAVDTDTRALEGRAPPDRSVEARVFSGPIGLLDSQPLTRVEQSILLSGRSDAAGRFHLACEAEDPACDMRYGSLSSTSGDDRYVLYWLRSAFAGLGVTANVATLRATAGRAARLGAMAPDGSEVLARQGRVLPRALELPVWEQSLEAAFAGPIPAGARVLLETDGRSFELVVPDLTILPDLLRDRVGGTGPPETRVAAVAFARGEDAARRGASATTGEIDARGRWSLQLPGFDLRPGDDLQVYLLLGDRYLWWDLLALDGEMPSPQEPPATTSPAPPLTPPPTDLPVATPTSARPTQLLLPWLQRIGDPQPR